VTVAGDMDNDGYVNGSVINTPQTFHLPQTGAAGVILLPLIGMGAMAGAAITLRRKAQSNN
jgi:LPXTG-motif cell wall-anchored protein